jgi:hypothetical protein
MPRLALLSKRAAADVRPLVHEKAVFASAGKALWHDPFRASATSPRPELKQPAKTLVLRTPLERRRGTNPEEVESGCQKSGK